MQSWPLVCWALLALAGAHECPDGGRCLEGHTCCSSPADGYACCPSEQAECCGDHLHCCPAGTVCDASSSGCVNATASVPWVARSRADRAALSKSFRMVRTDAWEEDDNVCPDESRCPAAFSCLKVPTGFGCCPSAQGVSCADGKHCCPEDRRCSADSHACIKKEDVATVLCEDGVSECPDGTTCCVTPDGGWGCCPLAKAVCCDDKLHCCPEGSTCDVEHSKCVSAVSKRETPMWEKLPARRRAQWENQKDNFVQCNATAACPDETTCCKTKDGGWACCPLPEAVCCSDFLHCCPKGKTCNLPEQSCDDGLQSVPWVKKVPAIQRKEVPCDQTTACPTDTTCCKTKDGSWACCPLPEAVCCSDFLHCCPKGKTCNLPEQSCDDGLQSVPWVKKVPAIQRQDVQVKEVPCDQTTACPTDTTCCKTKDGGWACCPLPEAVCCSDFLHCCPKGKTCNLPAQSCDDGLQSVPWVKKVPAIQRQEVQVKEVPCDQTTACPTDTTCCKTKDGSWACCPLPEAVCCSDFLHCCPKGKTCNLPAQLCDDGLQSVPWVEKVPAIQRQEVQVKEVPCDQTTACPTDTTCCKTKDGSWACCPLPEAVCCSDFLHCCPKGKTCNLPEQSCDDGLQSVPWVKKVPAIQRKEVQVKEVPCDQTTACPTDTTCCKTKDGGWACCPLPEAVCCSDFLHCCPKGKTCNLPAQSCDDGLQSIPWVEKVPAIQRQDVQVKEVPCDQTTACPTDTTCCKTKDGSWACCPLPEAVCCSDFLHCCPKGKTCNLPAQSCDDGLQSVPWVEKVPAIQRQDVQVKEEEEEEEDERGAEQEEGEAAGAGVPCDPHTSCPQRTTCCFMKELQKWGCCPLSEAVCCRDGKYCCPAHYECDESSSHCVKGDVRIPWYSKLPAATSVPDDDDGGFVQCDSVSKCPDGNTCCKLATGKWGCCPLVDAVCCSDMMHCCPNGHACTPSGECVETAALTWHQFLTGSKKRVIV